MMDDCRDKPVKIYWSELTIGFPEGSQIISQADDMAGIVMDCARRIVTGFQIDDEITDFRYDLAIVPEGRPRDIAIRHNEAL